MDGSVRVETILDLAKEQGVALPTDDLEELRKIVTVDNDCKSLEEYLVGFEIVNRVTQKPYALTRIMFEACEDAVKDGLVYVEIRFAPILHVNEQMKPTQVMEAVCDGLAMAEHHLPITARIIVCGMRHMSPSATISVAETAWRYRNRGVVAFDLAGPESGFRSSEHKDAFDLVRRKMLKMTVHSGEAAGPESILDAIRYCGAHRIGHGTSLGQAPELLQYVVDRRIPIEVCPTSNLQTKAVDALETHPMIEYFNKDVVIVVNTDNPRISQCTLSSELMVCHEVMGMSVADIVRLIDNGFRSVFLERGARDRMRSEALYQTVSILRSEGIDVSPIVNNPYYYGASVNFDRRLGETYWGTVPQPDISLDLIRALPKVDPHRRLSGSASPQIIWECLQEAHADPDVDVDMAELFKCVAPEGATAGEWVPPDYETFLPLIQRESHDRPSMRVAKAVFNAALQTREHIRKSMEDIYAVAARDNYIYFELVVNPRFHTSGGMDMEAVVEHVISVKSEMEGKHEGVSSGLILAVSLSPDKMCDPICARRVAELVVAHRDSVSGFGAYGSKDLPPSEYKFYQSTFDYLKDASVPVVMAAGSQSPDTIVSALSDGGASRISGGFQIHKEPNLFNYVADLSVPLELGVTDKLKLSTSDTGSFTPSPIAAFLDNDIVVSLCSFRQTLYTHDHSASIYDLVQRAEMNIAYLLKLLAGSLEAVFVPHVVKYDLAERFWDSATKLCHDSGFIYLHFLQYFQVPENEIAKYHYGAYDTNVPKLDMDLFFNWSLALRKEKESQEKKRLDAERCQPTSQAQARAQVEADARAASHPR